MLTDINLLTFATLPCIADILSHSIAAANIADEIGRMKVSILFSYKPHIMMIGPQQTEEEDSAENDPEQTDFKLSGFPKGNIDIRFRPFVITARVTWSLLLITATAFARFVPKYKEY